MPIISLPDGSTRKFSTPITGADIAADIGEGLLKAAVAIVVDGEQKDLTTLIKTDANVSIITLRDTAGIEILRHTTAHVLAQAVKALYSDAQITIGPIIANGFYYDIAFKENISSADLEKIETKMKEIIAADLPITRDEWGREKAISYFEDLGEAFKAELIRELPEGETLSVYTQGDFTDLCRGPHLPSTGKIGKAFKLMSLAAAYWRGDSNNASLTRIYGTAFADKKGLKNHLHMLEEAAKRDHRKLGPALDLFHLQEECPGQVFWHHNGWHIFRTLQDYIRAKLLGNGYSEVNTPQLVSSELYKKSGHWEKFGTENMFIVKDGDDNDKNQKIFAMKPMNCPCHVQIFNHSIKSYRDLPLRMSEFGVCMRNEAHGALHGLMRVTSMTQDDAHIFCSHNQIEEEVIKLCELIKEIYADFGFSNVFVKFSDRPEMRVGTDEVWDAAEIALKNACEAASLKWELNSGEGAFYGPKLEFVLKDCLGREWQCGTVQLDFNLPTRLGALYTDRDGQRKAPVMIHRALLGSLERFTGILVENFAGHFPLWLAPEQIVVTGITDKQNDHVQKLVERLISEGFRAKADVRNEKVSYKIREHSNQKIPVILVLGDREIENGTATVRRLGSQEQAVLSIEELIISLKAEVATKALPATINDVRAA